MKSKQESNHQLPLGKVISLVIDCAAGLPDLALQALPEGPELDHGLAKLGPEIPAPSDRRHSGIREPVQGELLVDLEDPPVSLDLSVVRLVDDQCTQGVLVEVHRVIDVRVLRAPGPKGVGKSGVHGRIGLPVALEVVEAVLEEGAVGDADGVAAYEHEFCLYSSTIERQFSELSCK